VAAEKIKKNHNDNLNIQLRKNPDILAEVAASGLAKFCVGFAAETEQLISHARDKLKRKQLDMVIANQVGLGQGFHQDDNEVVVITADKEIQLDREHKFTLAAKLIAIIAASLQNSD
jgi:phosphopantothenoylcysteine decarboxylase/phosphopantothenate--cysteine ligase